MIIALICGMLLGFISAIPVAGPISGLVLNLAMEKKFAQARALALGASLTEGIYALLAFLGFNQFLSRYKFVIPLSKVLAALILIGLGIHFYRSKKMRDVKPQGQTKSTGNNIIKEFFTGAGVSAANPTLIISWTTVISAMYSQHLFDFSRDTGAFFSLGICAGIFGWFNILLVLLKKYQNQLSPSLMDKALKAIAILLIALAVWMIISLVRAN